MYNPMSSERKWLYQIFSFFLKKKKPLSISVMLDPESVQLIVSLLKLS